MSEFIKEIQDPFEFAADKGDIDKIKQLIKNGQKPNTTALYLACFNGFIEIVKLILHTDKNLVHTPIESDFLIPAAVQAGNLELVNLLIKYGAEIKPLALQICQDVSIADVLKQTLLEKKTRVKK